MDCAKIIIYCVSTAEHYADAQDLTVELRLTDGRVWDLYDLSVHMVQLNREVMHLTEWKVFTPTVQRNNPKTKATHVKLKIQRLAGFYIQNVVVTMYVLSLLGPLAFVMDITDVGSRVGNVLTLILTAVAFKFVLAGALPKVCALQHLLLVRTALFMQDAWQSCYASTCTDICTMRPM